VQVVLVESEHFGRRRNPAQPPTLVVQEIVVHRRARRVSHRMTATATIYKAAMGWGHLPLAGANGAYDRDGDDAERSDEERRL
jgi:hypothetical protein